MVAAAMELKRLGLARKPLFAVPNHMLGQFSSELLTLYPGANILVAGKDDFEKDEAQDAYEPHRHRQLGCRHRHPLRLREDPAFRHARRRILQGAAATNWRRIRRATARSSGNSRIVKALERAKKRLEAKLKDSGRRTTRKTTTLTFEELGVDRLFVDEAHYFKNLFYVSKMTRIAGLPQTARSGPSTCSSRCGTSSA